jgi:hypothetical protein
MPVHEIDGVGHAELLQSLAEQIDDLSGQRLIGLNDEIKVRSRPGLERGA